MAQKPDLKLVQGGQPSLAEIAKQAAKAAEQERQEQAKRESEEKLNANLTRIAEINKEIEEAVRIVRSANPADRDAIIAQLDGPRTQLESEKTEILNDPDVQLTHINGLICELKECNRWRQIEEIAQAAVSRGWFKEIPKNKKGNLNLRAARFPKFNNPELEKACSHLKHTMFEAMDRVDIINRKPSK